MLITFILIIIIAGVITLDQLSKLLVVCFMELGQEIDVLPGFFQFKFITNYGMSFGLFDTPEKRPIFMIIAPIALIAIAVYLFIFSKDKLSMKIGLALIFGGGISNMIDRTFYGERIFHGEVIDMFDFYGIPFWNAIFNVADAFVCIGAATVVITLIVEIILEEKEKKKKVAKDAEELNSKMVGNILRELPKPTIDDENDVKNIKNNTSAKDFSENNEEKPK